MKFKLFIFLFFVIYVDLFSQAIKTISAEFEKLFIENNKIEHTKGEIFYKYPDVFYIKVDTPVNQIIKHDKQRNIIFYPESNQAFLVFSKNPINIPFFQSFISAIKEDNGLSGLGFSLKSNDFQNDTLVTIWKPPRKPKTLINKVILTYYDNKIISSQAVNLNNKVFVETKYQNHLEFNGFHFPLEISINKDSENQSSVETVVYSKPQFNIEIPGKVINFTLPKNAIIKEMTW